VHTFSAMRLKHRGRPTRQMKRAESGEMGSTATADATSSSSPLGQMSARTL
jgi:hypothetical protein